MRVKITSELGSHLQTPLLIETLIIAEVKPQKKRESDSRHFKMFNYVRMCVGVESLQFFQGLLDHTSFDMNDGTCNHSFHIAWLFVSVKRNYCHIFTCLHWYYFLYVPFGTFDTFSRWNHNIYNLLVACSQLCQHAWCVCHTLTLNSYSLLPFDCHNCLFFSPDSFSFLFFPFRLVTVGQSQSVR